MGRQAGRKAGRQAGRCLNLEASTCRTLTSQGTLKDGIRANVRLRDECLYLINAGAMLCLRQVKVHVCQVHVRHFLPVCLRLCLSCCLSRKRKEKRLKGYNVISSFFFVPSMFVFLVAYSDAGLNCMPAPRHYVYVCMYVGLRVLCVIVCY